MMKKIVISTIFVFALCSLAIAQTPREMLEKFRQIKPLESSREDVRRILADFEVEEDDEEHREEFDNDYADVEVWYTSGKCGQDYPDGVDEDEEETEIWNAAEWKVARVEIEFNEDVKTADLGVDLAGLKKEQHKDLEDLRAYFSRSQGIALREDEDEIERIYLFPAQGKTSMLCDNRRAKEFARMESWFESELGKFQEITHSGPANVRELILGASEIRLDCVEPGTKPKRPVIKKEISVETVAYNPQNDVLTYNYTVTAGRIVGKGAKIVWDLTGVKPGTYTITAGVDDGCGVCGTTRTETVVVKECPGGEGK